VIILGALTGQQTQTTIAALERGAVDLLPKTSLTNPADEDKLEEYLRKTVKLRFTGPP